MFAWDKTSAAVGLEAVAGCRAELLAELKDLLDAYHRRERTLAYYDRIAGDWLEWFAHATYMAMAEVIANGPREPWDKVAPLAADPAEYTRLRVAQPAFHHQLRAAVADLLAGESPASWRFSIGSARIESGGRRRLSDFASRTLATKAPDVLLVHPYFKCGRKDVAATLFRWRRWAAVDELSYPVRLEAQVDAPWRLGRAASHGAANDLRGVLEVLLPLHLPVALLEGFSSFRASVLSMPVARPKALYSANALHDHLPFKILAAEWGEQGTRLVYHQHGGGYGVDRVHVLEDYETRVSDRYFTWGWERRDRSNLQVVPFSLPRFERRPRPQALLNCIEFPQTAYRLHFHPMPGTIERMHEETLGFLNGFRDRSRLLVRPCPQDFGRNFATAMRRAAPEAQFDDFRVNAFGRYAQAGIVVHNYLGTAYLETLALNVPTVCFYDPDAYCFREDAEPHFRRLESVGILHASGRSAAAFASGILGDPDGWWLRPEVQEARTAFVDKYARLTTDWPSFLEQGLRSALEA